MGYKEYKKALKQQYIDNSTNFNRNLDYFLKDNQGIKIINIITHKPFHITIIYEELIRIN